MKKIIIMIMLLIPGFAMAGVCTVEPLPPIGCINGVPQCVCDGMGNCQWFFIGCER